MTDKFPSSISFTANESDFLTEIRLPEYKSIFDTKFQKVKFVIYTSEILLT